MFKVVLRTNLSLQILLQPSLSSLPFIFTSVESIFIMHVQICNSNQHGISELPTAVAYYSLHIIFYFCVHPAISCLTASRLSVAAALHSWVSVIFFSTMRLNVIWFPPLTFDLCLLREFRSDRIGWWISLYIKMSSLSERQKCLTTSLF